MLKAAFFWFNSLSFLLFCARDITLHQNTYLPEEFLREMQAIMPSGHDVSDFAAACRRPLRKSIRVNTLKFLSMRSLNVHLIKAGSYHPFHGVMRAFGLTLMNLLHRWVILLNICAVYLYSRSQLNDACISSVQQSTR